MSIRENWLSFKEELALAAEEYGRDVSGIRVMAVSKTRPAEDVVEAAAAGLDLFGENRIDEANGKFAALDPEIYPLCIIGHVQSNKVSRIGPRIAGVHSVDSVKLARKLSDARRASGAPLEILVQVNTSGENSKSGFQDRSECLDAAAEMAALPFLEFKGLMTMAPFVDDEKRIRECFAVCREWAEGAAQWAQAPVVLSMGMSSDYRWAVAEGSTLLRIGTTIFGGR